MQLLSKEELIEKILYIFRSGWHKSIKKTIDIRNDGAVGNTLEELLNINENNLPIPNAGEWELKGQRKQTGSLITLKHLEPSPRSAKIVTNVLLPFYGWKHKQAGKKYSIEEKNSRQTLNSRRYTNRGFIIIVDKQENKVKVHFDSSKADMMNLDIKEWIETVKTRIGLGPLNPEPFWGFEDLKYEIGSKVKNCFYVVADTKIENKQEYFNYKELYMLSEFSFNNFVNCIEVGDLLVDFDARTNHNHGTKFRLRQGRWASLYSSVKRIF